MYTTTAAKILVAMKWKSEKIPTVTEWQVQMIEYLQLAMMTGSVRGYLTWKIHNEWKIFKDYLKNCCNNKNLLAGLD